MHLQESRPSAKRKRVFTNFLRFRRKGSPYPPRFRKKILRFNNNPFMAKQLRKAVVRRVTFLRKFDLRKIGIFTRSKEIFVNLREKLKSHVLKV